MEHLLSLLNVLKPEQTKELDIILRKSEAAASQLICLLIEGEILEENIRVKLKVNPATFPKVQTQAKKILTDFISRHLRNPLSDVQLVQALILKGELKTAKKFFSYLEKEFERSQDWQKLDFLYHEGFRLTQMTGDVKLLQKIAQRRSRYAKQYADYVSLYGEVMIEMVRSEKFEERKSEVTAYLKRAEQLNKRAYAGGHHALIHNSLLIIYHVYSRYYNQPDKTHQIVKKIMANHKKHESIMNRVTDAIIRINVINFLCIHETYGSPEPYLEEAWNRVDRAGILARTNLIYALLGYYLCKEDTVNVNKYLSELDKIQDNTHFASFRSVVLTVLAFIRKDYNAFTKHLNEFYTDPNHINLPDSEVIVRILELLVIKRETTKDRGIKQFADEQHYKSKADALRIYFQRNLNKVRYAEEYNILSYLITPSAKNEAKVQALFKSKYRNSRMLAKYVLASTY